MTETDTWPVIPARWFTKVSGSRKVRLIVIHTMESPENAKTAENVAHYFRTTATKASAHVCVDSDSIVQCVTDNNVAFAAPGANSDGIQIEIAGRAGQTAEQWDDEYSRRALNNAAHAAAQYALKYGIPVRHLTNAQLRSGSWGIIGHDQATAVYKLSTHTDPGSFFPWDRFIATTMGYYAAREIALTR